MSHSLPCRQIAPATARALVDAALARARSEGWEIAAAVADPFGYLVAFGRSDAVAPPIGGFAIDKAYTAATLRRTSKGFGERMAGVPTLALGLSNRARFIAWGGGVPIFEDGICIGALGISGAHEHEDIACAEDTIRAVGLTPG